MNNQTANFVNMAKQSGKKDAEARERSQRILDYYRGNKSGKDKK